MFERFSRMNAMDVTVVMMNVVNIVVDMSNNKVLDIKIKFKKFN